MKTFFIISITLSALFLTIPLSATLPVQEEAALSDKTDNLQKYIKIVESIKKDMTRADVEKYFILVGGLKGTNDKGEKYQAKTNRHISLDVEYQYVKKGYINDKDKIVKISSPYFDPSNPPGS